VAVVAPVVPRGAHIHLEGLAGRDVDRCLGLSTETTAPAAVAATLAAVGVDAELGDAGGDGEQIGPPRGVGRERGVDRLREGCRGAAGTEVGVTAVGGGD